MKHKKKDEKSLASKSGKKSKHKKKKSKGKDKKKDKKERKFSDSSYSSSTDSEVQEVWVEKTLTQQASTFLEENASSTLKESEPIKREDWMDLNSVFPCVFNASKEERKAKQNKDKDNNILDTPGQSKRELNPYWKNGGDGLPQADLVNPNVERVMDVKWLKKSFQRAQEQAETEGRSLHEIAAERWGSLDAIVSMIAKAESSATEKRNRLNDTKHNWSSNQEFKSERRATGRDRYRDNRQHSYDTVESRRIRSRSRSRDRIRQYERSNSQLFEKRQKQLYKKPTNDDCFTMNSYKVKESRVKKWKKEKVEDETVETKLRESVPELKNHDVEAEAENEKESEESKPLTVAELNKLGAKIVKAELMGDTELATKLKTQMEEARKLSVNHSVASRESKEVENVILTRTDNKGITRPLQPRQQTRESAGSSKKRKNVQTHVSGERVRHYFDDDKYSLDQLFQREKGRSACEDDAAFVKLASKSMDMNDVFEQEISRSRSETKQDDNDRSVAIKEHKRLTKSLDNCRWCVDSKYMLKHMIVAMETEICLSLPRYTSLTEGHCILSPVQHIPCQLQLDEDVWEKLKVFKRALCKIFADRNQCPVFFEIYTGRHKFPHMQLECVPLPKEIGDSAPMYFKKALLECETEWSINKKVIDLKQKDVRQSVPNGLSYFMVEFDTNDGYAHVIEDEHMFPKNFAEEIIGGMLDLDHDLWRKPKKENFDQQREKVLKFSQIWKKYDFGIKDHTD